MLGWHRDAEVDGRRTARHRSAGPTCTSTSLNSSLARGELDGTFQSLIGSAALRRSGRADADRRAPGARRTRCRSASMLGLSALGAGFLEPIANLVGTAMQADPAQELHGAHRRRARRAASSATRPAQRPAARSLQRRASRCADLSFRYPSEPQPDARRHQVRDRARRVRGHRGRLGLGQVHAGALLAGLYTPASGSIAYRRRRRCARWDLHAPARAARHRHAGHAAVLGHAARQRRAVRARRCRTSASQQRLPSSPACTTTSRTCRWATTPCSPTAAPRSRAASASACRWRARCCASPSVLILDEATSALDTVTEQRVQEQLRELACTRVVVAHRLSTIVEADKIVVLDAGKLVAVGRHAELLLRCPQYQVLIRAQHEPQGAASFVPRLSRLSPLRPRRFVRRPSRPSPLRPRRCVRPRCLRPRRCVRPPCLRRRRFVPAFPACRRACASDSPQRASSRAPSPSSYPAANRARNSLARWLRWT